MIHTRRRTLVTHRMLGHDDGSRFTREGTAPAVFAIHGFSGTTSELRPLLEAIADAGFAVTAPLLPGHGTAPQELQEHTFETWLEAARSEMRALVESHGSVVLLGFSLGSLVAIALAAELGDDPCLRGFVALGNAVTLTPISRWPLGIAHRMKFAMPDWYLLKFKAADITDDAAGRIIKTYDRQPLRAAMEVYRAGERVRAMVPRITCPTLVLHGARDRVCGVRNAEWLASNVSAKRALLRVFPRSAHVLACDVERDEVAREAVDFLRTLRADPSDARAATHRASALAAERP